MSETHCPRCSEYFECAGCEDLFRRLKRAVDELKSTEEWLRGQRSADGIEIAEAIAKALFDIEEPPKQ